MKDQIPEELHFLESDELLPDIRRWIVIGGGVLICVLGISVILAAILKFKVAVKTPATIRPVGELRLVQAAMEGTVVGIDVKENQLLKQGQVIARFDASRIQTKGDQLKEDIAKKQVQLSANAAQIHALDSQLVAESNLASRNLVAAQANLQMHQRAFRREQLSTQADLQEATAGFNLAKEELARFRQLRRTRAIAELQFREKAASAQVALARLNKVRSTLNPSDAQVMIAAAQIAQEQAKGQVAVANIRREREQLLQAQAELQSQIQAAQKERNQLQTDLARGEVRAPASGTLMQLNLRNPGQVVQSGQAIAYIAPQDAPFIIKAEVNAQDITKISPGQKVEMQVSACPYPDYGTLKGTVQTVAPDALPENSGSQNSVGLSSPGSTPSLYGVTIRPQTSSVGYGKRQCRLQAGMEGRADIISHEETVMQFILKKARLVTNL
ncbi:MAG: HlyD family secretion protein [Aphanocapsa sp. GSE-SYN-MK-11-07L]|jgi:HlyD family secretion protein|nr:HlyD family secretion protein [Aphanocapsa sp. GSE-SYN-MK-11-07L]